MRSTLRSRAVAAAAVAEEDAAAVVVAAVEVSPVPLEVEAEADIHGLPAGGDTHGPPVEGDTRAPPEVAGEIRGLRAAISIRGHLAAGLTCHAPQAAAVQDPRNCQRAVHPNRVAVAFRIRALLAAGRPETEPRSFHLRGVLKERTVRHNGPCNQTPAPDNPGKQTGLHSFQQIGQVRTARRSFLPIAQGPTVPPEIVLERVLLARAAQARTAQAQESARVKVI